MSRAEFLAAELERLRAAFYSLTPAVPDEEYDALKAEYLSLVPPLASFPKSLAQLRPGVRSFLEAAFIGFNTDTGYSHFRADSAEAVVHLLGHGGRYKPGTMYRIDAVLAWVKEDLEPHKCYGVPVWWRGRAMVDDGQVVTVVPV